MRGLFFINSLHNASSRYRVLQFLPGWRAAGLVCDVVEIPTNSRDRWRSFGRCEDYDFAFLQRKLLPAHWLWRIRRRARRLVFDFDDAIMFRSSSHADPHSRGRQRAFARTMRAADLVLCGNEFLETQCRPFTRNAVIVPTVVDADRYQSIQPTAKDTVTLGWIGSRSTLPYLESLRPVLDEIGRTHPHVRLKIICDAFPRFDHLPVVGVPWNEATEADEVASFDIGLMPLVDDLWSRGKCGLKILQYHAAGVPCVASPVGVNARMIEEGATGCQATAHEEWRTKLESLIADPQARERMGRTARDRMTEQWSLATWQPRLLELLQRTATKPTRRVA